MSLARVLAQHAPILMLDEPTAALDIHHQERLLTILAERRQAGAAILIVVHDLSLAAAYADRVLVTKAGEIVASGPTRDVMTADLLTKIYDHPVITWTHPGTGQFIDLPDRSNWSAGHSPPAPRRPEY